ncbi:MAG: DUF1631 domain-containing protein [Gammaproteobacteria bacterium]|nr:DUF1631 domain-containing protein [Gammaproteobacteria bacterium]
MTTDRDSTTLLKHPQDTQPSVSSKEFQEQCLAAAERFSEHFMSIIDGLSETLYQMADQADEHELRRLYFSALQELYSSRSKSKNDFKKQFLATIKAEIQSQPNRQAALFTNAALTGIEQLTKLPPQQKPQEETMPEPPAIDQNAEDKHSQMANSLPKGSWIEFNAPDSPTLKARFTWTNPVTGIYLFIDRDGRKAPDRTPDELATAFRNGHASLIQDAAQLARAASNHSR